MKNPGVIAGLRREAACLDGLPVLSAGASAARACQLAAQLLAGGCDGLISFGTAGGLDPALAPGTLVVADRVIRPDGQSLAVDADWRHQILASIGGAEADFQISKGSLAGSDQLLSGVQAKADLFAKTGARAVDMESHAVAEIAHAQGVPFLALRAIADPADFALPNCVAHAVGPGGEVRILSILGVLIPRLGELGRLRILARHSRASLTTLCFAARHLNSG